MLGMVLAVLMTGFGPAPARVTLAASPPEVTWRFHREPVRLSGQVRPARAGVRVRLTGFNVGYGAVVGRRVARTDRRGRFSVVVRPRFNARWVAAVGAARSAPARVVVFAPLFLELFPGGGGAFELQVRYLAARRVGFGADPAAEPVPGPGRRIFVYARTPEAVRSRLVATGRLRPRPACGPACNRYADLRIPRADLPRRPVVSACVRERPWLGMGRTVPECGRRFLG